MLTYSPSGALSPYYYKGGSFHGIHFGSYFNDMQGLEIMMKIEEEFLLKKNGKQRIMIDFYETNLTGESLDSFVKHIVNLKSKIYKMAISAEPKRMKIIKKALYKSGCINKGNLYFATDMEEAKTWLVN